MQTYKFNSEKWIVLENFLLSFLMFFEAPIKFSNHINRKFRMRLMIDSKHK